MSSEQQQNNDIVVSETKRGVGYYLRGWRKFVLLAVVALLAAGGGYWWLLGRDTTPSKDAKTVTAPPPNTKVPEPTEEQKHIINETTREEGTVTAVAKDSITLQIEGQDTPLMLKTDDKTLYSAGADGFPTERATIKSGQKAVVAYDKQQKTMLSIWVNYDTK